MTPDTRFKGVSACGCTVFLYDGEHDTQKQRERTITKALKSGLRLVPLRTEADDEQARKEWGGCTHEIRYEDPAAEARKLLA